MELGWSKMAFSQVTPLLDILDNFPGWDRASGFLEDIIARRGLLTIADLGGGARPQLGREFIQYRGIDYTVLDIDQVELDKAPGYCHKVCIDASAGDFSRTVGANRYDLMFSHMFLEHVKDPAAVHRNIWAALKPGGIAVHMFPAPYNLPLAANRLLPECVSRKLLRSSNPMRHVGGENLKFPAFYRMCEPPSPAAYAKFENIGFDVLRYTGFIGHEYYRRIPVLREVERASRRLLLKLHIPAIAFVLLVLRKSIGGTGGTQ